MSFTIIWELIVTLVVMLKSIVISIIHTFVPVSQKSVKDEIVLLTGAGSGIGRLMAEELARRGAVIVAWDVNQEGNEETAEHIKAMGGRIYTYTCDVSKREEVYSVADQVKRDVGDVTILINNAGIVSGRNFLDCTDQQLLKTMEVNVMGHFWTLKSFLPSMVKKNHGHVVTIASMGGIIGVNRLADYCASKFANVGFMESLSLELMKTGKDGIMTTTVCPHTINTGMFAGVNDRFPQLMPDMTPEYAANRIVQAILTNQKILYMPRVMYTMGILKSLLPVEASLALMKFFGGLDFMTEFRGRGQSSA